LHKHEPELQDTPCFSNRCLDYSYYPTCLGSPEKEARIRQCLFLTTFILSGDLLILSENASRNDYLQKLETLERIGHVEESVDDLQPLPIKRKIGVLLDQIHPSIKSHVLKNGSMVIKAPIKPYQKDALWKLVRESNGRLLQLDNITTSGGRMDLTLEGTFVFVKFWVSHEIYTNPDEPYECKIPDHLKTPPGAHLYDHFANFLKATQSPSSSTENPSTNQSYVVQPKIGISR